MLQYGGEFKLVHLTERVFLNSGWFTNVLMLRPGHHRAVSATEGNSETSAAPVFSSLLTDRVGTLTSSLPQDYSLATNLRHGLVLNVTEDGVNIEVA